MESSERVESSGEVERWRSGEGQGGRSRGVERWKGGDEVEWGEVEKLTHVGGEVDMWSGGEREEWREGER